jgi:hypothetical protein
MRAGLVAERTAEGVALRLPLSSGMTVRVEFSIGGDLTHVRCGDHGVAVLDRDRFQRWLAAPHGEFATDDVMFVEEGRRIALMVRGLAWWWLTQEAFAALRAVV